LLDHILLLSGGKNRGAKDKATRAQGCTLVSALIAQVSEYKAAEEKLLEFALDKVPSIREKAVRGLAGLASPTAEMALMARTTDQCTAVRASAVRGLRVSARTAGTLLERIDDVEACVRAQLFMRLSEQPACIDELGPAALARLIAGLSDRTSSVRNAAGQAVDAWVQHLGGVLPLLGRCDLKSDEALGEAAAAALAARYPEEGSRVARQWLGQVTGKDKASTLPDGPAPVLMARLALASMSEADREEVLDVASLVQRAHAVLKASQKKTTNSTWQEYLLRQLLHVVALADIGDEGLRRQVEKLAEAVLCHSPLPSASVTEIGTTAGTCRMAQSSIDLGIVILRKVNGLVRFQAQTAKHQVVEARCSTRVVLLVSEICQPFETSANDDDEGEDSPFTTRLSLQIQELNNKIDELQNTKASIDQAKKKALVAEDYLQAQKLKEQTRKNEKELAANQEERNRLLEQRDGVCLRVLAIVGALLRWSNSDIRKDPALMGTLDQILLPLVGLPALSKEVEVSVVSAICLFCVRDGVVTRRHWSLLLELLRGLQEVEKATGTHQPGSEGFVKAQSGKALAAVAARALADCSRLHGGFLDRDEVLSCAQALAAVPFSSRQVVIEPLCGWMLSLGHIFFEEHLKEPVLEVQWALGWMLVEAFKQRRQPEDSQVEGKIKLVDAAPNADAQKKRGLSWVTRNDEETKSAALEAELGDMDDGSDVTEAIATASRMTQFFALLPKLPGKHGEALLSLALESVCESGLWRRGVLLPHSSDGQTRWLRNFSWPELFSFVHERLPADMRFRLWRCSLQICVNDPPLAPLAEIPFALASVASDAPPGASELLQEALDLGADPEALGPLRARLPQLPEKAGAKRQKSPAVGMPLASANPKLLIPPAAGKAAEKARRAELASLGINIDVWAPGDGDVEVPKMVPQFHRMRMAVRRPRGAKKGQENAAEVPAPKENALPEPKSEAAAKAPLESTQEPEGKRRRRMGKQTDDAEARLPLQEIAR